MRQIEQIKQRYDRALERYKIQNPTLAEINQTRQFIVCGLCSARVLTTDITEHMHQHEQTPPANLSYQLTLPFRTINGHIQRGAKFVKLLIISDVKTIETPFGSSHLSKYNGLLLSDWTKLQDTEDVTIRWSKKKRRFIRTLWTILVFTLIFM